MKTVGTLAAAAALGLVLLASAAPASATPLIGFNDLNPKSAGFGGLSDVQNWGMAWTQTVASNNVTVRVVLNDRGTPNQPGNWWIVNNALGPGTTLSDVVASGTFVSNSADSFDFNGQPRTTLATGLHFDPGIYVLVLDGVGTDIEGSDRWVGDKPGDYSTTLAPGFSLFGLFLLPNPDSFGPKTPYQAIGGAFAFELDAVPVPEPTTWALLLTGFGLAGAALRSARRRGGATA